MAGRDWVDGLGGIFRRAWSVEWSVNIVKAGSTGASGEVVRESPC
jgi:hypothetical protein